MVFAPGYSETRLEMSVESGSAAGRQGQEDDPGTGQC